MSIRPLSLHKAGVTAGCQQLHFSAFSTITCIGFLSCSPRSVSTYMWVCVSSLYVKFLWVPTCQFLSVNYFEYVHIFGPMLTSHHCPKRPGVCVCLCMCVFTGSSVLNLLLILNILYWICRVVDLFSLKTGLALRKISIITNHFFSFLGPIILIV